MNLMSFSLIGGFNFAFIYRKLDPHTAVQLAVSSSCEILVEKRVNLGYFAFYVGKYFL